MSIFGGRVSVAKQAKRVVVGLLIAGNAIVLTPLISKAVRGPAKVAAAPAGSSEGSLAVSAAVLHGCPRMGTAPSISDGVENQAPPVDGRYSHNWAGYARTESHATGSSGAWTVPTVIPSTRARYSSTWVGVDGFGNSKLIQTGTSQNTVAGHTDYYAWWEVLPADENRLPMKIEPGDVVTALVTWLCGQDWMISVKDVTAHETWSHIEGYSGAGGSVEAVVEAPVINGRPSTLADFQDVHFRHLRTDGSPAKVLPAEGIEMVDPSDRVIAMTSKPPSGAAFIVDYVGAK